MSLTYSSENIMFTMMITNLNWFSYTGMYIDHTVFDHCVQTVIFCLFQGWITIY